MTDAELSSAIEIAGEAVYGGFADDGSFEHLLSRAVLELAHRLKLELAAYQYLLEEIEDARRQNQIT